MIPRAGAQLSTRCGPRIPCRPTPKRASTVAPTRSIASQARSGLLILTFDINQSPSPRNSAMAGGSHGDQDHLGGRPLTPGLVFFFAARGQWVSGRPAESPAYAGTDFIIARDGRIAALYLFFDKLP